MIATYKQITADHLDITIAMMQAFYDIDGYPIAPDCAKKLLSTFIADQTLGRSWLIFLDQEPIGYCILTFIFSFEFSGTIAFIDELYLLENARGKGIGKNTVKFLQSEARKLSVKMLYLEVESHNTNAQKVYQSAGFSFHSRKFMQYQII